MDFPLQPKVGVEDSDEILERFLDYVAEKNIELYEAQEEAILEIFSGKNVILNTPTGSGKSLVAAAMHYRSCSLGRRSIYTCPIKALVNEKFLSLCRDFGPENVGMMTGDASVNRNAPILCCTAEILSNIALRDGDKAEYLDIIMDEFHYYSDQERGVAWQVPLLTMPQSRFLLISATLGETRFFEKEMEKLTGVESVTVSSQIRPVPLEFTYEERTLIEQLDELLSRGRVPVYIVHFTQKTASDTAQNLLSLNVCNKDEKKAIAEELKEVVFSSPFGKEIKKYLSHGIGLHHAGLLPKYRVLVEKLAQKGLLKIICGTDTLGVGVNVPIRCVLFTQLCKYGGQKTGILSVRDFHQISGRAGRKGFDDIGYVVALAPEHVVDNKRQEAKAAGDAKKKRKLVKRKPPERGFVHWDEDTYNRLQNSKAESLESRFRVTHGMLLNVLSRNSDGCRAMRDLVDNCHNTEFSKQTIRRKAFQLFRSLVDRDIIEILKEREENGRKVRVNVELQDDFSLNQTLSLYCIDTLDVLDRDDPDYGLKVLSLVESILENPDVILRRQLSVAKDEKVAEMKAAGVEYEERMEKLELVEYPKPEGEFIYETFNIFAKEHPWVGKENIKPKSIAREMFERYSSFGDYVKIYGLQRAEGLLLRHLTNVYRALENTVPVSFKDERIQEISTYLEHLLKHVDSSLIDEWEMMRNPDYKPSGEDADSLPEREVEADITQPKSAFTRLVRNEVFRFIRSLANKDYESLAEEYELAPLFESDDSASKWMDVELEKRMTEFYESRSWIRLDPEARSNEHTRISISDDQKTWFVEQTLIDSEELNDWAVVFAVDLDESKAAKKVSLKVTEIGPFDQLTQQ